MSEHLIGRLVQTSTKNNYRKGPCACGSCSVFTPWSYCNSTNDIRDWSYATDTCCGGFCTSQPRCAPPNKDECSIGLSKRKQDPLVYHGWDKNAPNLKCVYNLDKIDTIAQVNNFENKFGKNNIVKEKFCTQKVNTCTKDMKECSRLKSIGEGGNECRRWFESQPTHIQDATMQNYCLSSNTEDCKCVNRAETDKYQKLKGIHSINDGCWYTACANRSKYLVPSHLVDPVCPDKMCQVIYDIIGHGDVSIYENDIVCNFGESTDDNNNVQENESLKFIYIYKYEIIVSVILVILLVFMFMLF